MNNPTVPPTAGPLRSAGRAVARAVRAVIWWFNAILGGGDYQRYVQHQRLHHPGAPIPSEREYWKQRHDAADRNPSNRCC
ncbi:YbdD/YjiX family protein [Nocardia huaxiensis]|uniref:YbdD/YjiX family protein n=1 Tax=Nocardia huaxiensis TaxID=2755382 RepID=A0A7D6ZFY7_9NOCA|nr:YbdD/YjiX family protein [Nocardia huaxiensis]